MTANLEFTGERYVPGTVGEIAHEHWHRYAFARAFVTGRRVLDVACGEGYGAALLADRALQVTGVDVDPRTLAHARTAYADRSNVAFVEGSAAALPLAAASFDAIISFETIEHLSAADQPRMLAEFARVLAPGGLVILSSPNRPEYSERTGYVNPFHLHELDRAELAALLEPRFPAQRWHCQRRYVGSALWADDANGRYEAFTGTASSVADAIPPEALYFVVVAASTPDALPGMFSSLSLFTDIDDAELKRIDNEARKAMRLDALVRTCGEEIERHVRNGRELQAVVASRDREIVEQERARAALREELARQIHAQEQIIGYRESVRWWLTLPWLRARRLWNRIRAA